MLDRLIAEAPRFFTYYTVIFLLEAMLRTLLMTVLGCGLGLILGVLLVVVRQTRSLAMLPLRVLVIAYIEVFRRIPFLVILFLALFAVQALKLDVSLTGIALIGICVIGTAFLSEIVRAGFESVSWQQREAAEAMNFGLIRTLWYVVLPQSWKTILPPAFAYMVMFIKDTALASHMGVTELTFSGKVLINRGFSSLLVLGVILVAYFAMSYPLSRLGAYLEKRLASPRGQRSVLRLSPAPGAAGHLAVDRQG
jgi:polar amino acid transport system permease protein